MNSIDIIDFAVSNKDKIWELQHAMISGIKSGELKPEEFEVSNYFVNGMYCRKSTCPANAVVVGKVHKKEHFFICAKGEMLAWSEDGIISMKEGDVLSSLPGTKRAIYALSDSIGITVHKTDKTDLAELEEELIEQDDTAIFDSSNKIKESMIQYLKTGVIK